LFDSAVAGGAQVLDAPRGLIEGASLDVVSLDTEQPELVHRREDDILDSWVFSGGRQLVDCVWRAGEKVVSHGRHRHREAIVARYRQALNNLLS
jgi:cytosine/adenosine deaminase-related metal-dependent hydrolase